MIPLYEPKLSLWDGIAVASQVWHNRIGPGAMVTAFEKAVAREMGVAHCVATTSGTMALVLALKALKIPAGATIFVPAYGFVAAAEASRFLGYKVQLVDIEQHSLQMDPAKLWSALKETGIVKAGAVIYIEHNGKSSDCEIASICRGWSVPVIADAACSLGVSHSRREARLTTLSFSVPKLVTCGQGGAVLTNDDVLARDLRDWTDHGGAWRTDRIYRKVGLNARMTDIQAALGHSQLRRLDKLIRRRVEIRSWYLEQIDLVPQQYDGWFCIYRTSQAAPLVEWLTNAGVEAKQLYRPIFHSPAYGDLEGCTPEIGAWAYPEAELAYRELVYLPSGLTLRRGQVQRVCEQIALFHRYEELPVVPAA